MIYKSALSCTVHVNIVITIIQIKSGKWKNCSLLDAVVIAILQTAQSTQISLYKYMHTYAYACELFNITTMGVCIHVCEHVVSEYDDWIIITCYVYTLKVH